MIKVYDGLWKVIKSKDPDSEKREVESIALFKVN